MAKRRVYALEFANHSDADRVRALDEVEQVLRRHRVEFGMGGEPVQAMAELSRSAGASDYGPGKGQQIRMAKLPGYRWGDDGTWRDGFDLFLADNVNAEAVETALRAAGFEVQGLRTISMSRSGGGGSSDEAIGAAAFAEGEAWKNAELRRRGIDPLQAEVDRNLGQTDLGRKALAERASGRVA